MAKKEKPLFASLLSGDDPAFDFAEESIQIKNEKTTNPGEPAPDKKQEPSSTETSQKENGTQPLPPAEERATEKPRRPRGRPRKKAPDGTDAEGPVVMGGEEFRLVSLHMSLSLFTKIHSIAHRENTTFKDVVNQGMAAAVEKYESRHGELSAARANSNIFG